MPRIGFGRGMAMNEARVVFGLVLRLIPLRKLLQHAYRTVVRLSERGAQQVARESVRGMRKSQNHRWFQQRRQISGVATTTDLRSAVSRETGGRAGGWWDGRVR